MGKIAEVQEVTLGKLIPYVNNAKIHDENQISRIAGSIREFGFLNPVLIDRKFNIIAGHGRVMAAKKLEMKTVPCVFVEGLTEAQRKAYILADNRLAELGTWDMEIAVGEFEELRDMNFDLSVLGFNFPDIESGDQWFEREEKEGNKLQDGNEEYNAFLEKFELAKTTDDCYTPDLVYEAVANWVSNEYGVDRSVMVRPFYPGGDYTKEKYDDGAVVVDNPPFSIFAEILRFYRDNNIKYFLFGPGLTIFSPCSNMRACAIPTGANVTYENGASVNTSFITNLEDENLRVRTAPDLHDIIVKANEEANKENKRELPSYIYPDNIVTSAMVARWSKYGVDYKLYENDCVLVDGLDAQKEVGKAIYGKGYLLSERAAAERAAAERAAAERAAATAWQLSDREKEIIKSLGNL